MSEGSDVYNRLQADASAKSQTLTVKFYRHDVRIDQGKTYLWNLSREFKTWDQLLRTLAKDIHGPTGPSQRVYDLEGNQVTSLEELKDHGIYVCCGGEKFTKEGIPPHAVGGDIHAPMPHHTTTTTHATEPTALTQMIDDDINKNRTKECWFYPAVGQSVKTAKGAKLIINPSRYRTVDQLIGEVRGKVSLVTGPIQKLYDLEGNELTSIDGLKNHGKYICSIARAFNKSMIPPDAEAAN
eukprot:c6416_g1_i1.p1 GENE.c6416_g1_i1~~c6416_g1_i1.p1  ORF type:complete len:256 (+),score=74.59 c6416_g1_i1:51-770(+)